MTFEYTHTRLPPFDTFEAASAFIAVTRPRLDCGTATAWSGGAPVEWAAMSRGTVHDRWDRLCIVAGGVVCIERTPRFAIRDDLSAEIVPLDRVSVNE
jgi:hypothetical protein